MSFLATLTPALLVATTPVTGDELFFKRVSEVTINRGELKQYDPQEAINGATQVKPLAKADKPTVEASAVEAARAYAKQNNSNAFIIWRDGKVEHESYFGQTTADSLIVSKSLAKPLTAIAVGRAIRLGKIKSLDQPVADFITEWRGKPQAAMKIRHLLDMRSGLLAQGFNDRPDNHWNRAYLDPDHGNYIINQYPLTDMPGSIYEYSNATSELVAIVIERATGRRYSEFIGSEILAKIGAPGGKVWINRPGGLAHAGCCTMLPVQSWLRMAILLLQDGKWKGRKLLPAGYVSDMRKGTAQNPHYGLGLWLAGPYVDRRGFQNPQRPGPKVLHSQPYLARDLFMFDGNSNQIVYIIPSAKMIILRTGDSPPRQPEWDNSFLPNTLLRGASGFAPQPQLP
ncbi:MAG: serine hydrolase [Sphingomonadaceae bacterium]|nr:serine hydrolase [Sphingomonadaceae bacterium]